MTLPIVIGALRMLKREHEEGRIQLGAWEPQIPGKSLDWAYIARDPETGFAVICAFDVIRDRVRLRTKNSIGQTVDMVLPNYGGETPEAYLQRFMAPLMPFLAKGKTLCGIEMTAR